MVSNEKLYSTLATRKCDYLSVMKPSTYIIHKASVRSFSGLKMRFIKGHETLG